VKGVFSHADREKAAGRRQLADTANWFGTNAFPKVCSPPGGRPIVLSIRNWPRDQPGNERGTTAHEFAKIGQLTVIFTEGLCAAAKPVVATVSSR
jgi:hypothetical protein